MRILKKGVLVMMISFVIGRVNVNRGHAGIDVSGKSAMIIEGG